MKKLSFFSRSATLRAGFALCVFAGSAAYGQDTPSGRTISIHLDPARTKVTFTSGSFLHKIHGTMQLKGGLFAYEAASGVAQGQILVDAESAKTGDPKLDKRLQEETLESAKYPEIFFHPEKSTGGLANGKTQLELSGSFTIHGSDHPMKVVVNKTGTDDDPVLTTTFTVPYVQWGLRNLSSWMMHDKTVEVTVEAHGKVEALEPRSKG